MLDPATGLPDTNASPSDAGELLALRFADLFDNIGSFDLGYSATARELSGRHVAIEGYLSRTHGLHATVSLANEAGICADCAPTPVPIIALPGARLPLREGDGLVRVVGRLDYGLRIVGGVASMLRIEEARIVVRDGAET